MTLVDLYRNVYSLVKKSYRANSSDLAILFIIIGEWNEQRRPDGAFISKQALQNLSSLSETTVRRSLQKLLSWRIIGTERLNGQVVIKIRPQADWRMAGENAANERRTAEKSCITHVRVQAGSEEDRAENARTREDEDDTPVSLADILKERRQRQCPEMNTPQQSR